MRVVAINGSPHKEGNTYQALKIVGSKLEENGIEFEIIHVGLAAVRGCTGCGTCWPTRRNAPGSGGAASHGCWAPRLLRLPTTRHLWSGSASTPAPRG